MFDLAEAVPIERPESGDTSESFEPAARMGRYSPDFWRLFRAALFYDFGFGLYFFLVNLYLADLHFTARAIGTISGALTLGTVLVSMPVGYAARRFGLSTVLLFSTCAAALIAALRALCLSFDTQLVFAFLQGTAMAGYVVCYPAALAGLTTDRQRSGAFSLSFGAGIGSGVVAGLAGGYLPALLTRAGLTTSTTGAMQLVLIAAALLVLGSIPILARLHLPPAPVQQQRVKARPNRFLISFFCALVVWSLACGSFQPFAVIYLAQRLKLPLHQVGLIFSVSQAFQVVGLTAAAPIYRRTGLVTAIGCVQICTGIAFLCLSHSALAWTSVLLFLALTMFQYMITPGIYCLVMTRAAEQIRPTVSATQAIVTSLSLAGAAQAGGLLLTCCGYVGLFSIDGILAMSAGVFSLFALRERK